MDYGKIAYVGGGNMTRALAGGMLAAGYEASHVLISEPLTAHRESLATELPGAVIFKANEDAVRDAECIVFAVKPQILCEVCKPLAAIVQKTRPLIISIAAGVRARDIESWLGGNLPVVRVMPASTAAPGYLRAVCQRAHVRAPAACCDQHHFNDRPGDPGRERRGH